MMQNYVNCKFVYMWAQLIGVSKIQIMPSVPEFAQFIRYSLKNLNYTSVTARTATKRGTLKGFLLTVAVVSCIPEGRHWLC